VVVITVQQTVLHGKAGVAVVQGQARVISESAHCESMYRFQGALRVSGRSTVYGCAQWAGWQGCGCAQRGTAAGSIYYRQRGQAGTGRVDKDEAKMLVLRKIPVFSYIDRNPVICYTVSSS